MALLFLGQCLNVTLSSLISILYCIASVYKDIYRAKFENLTSTLRLAQIHIPVKRIEYTDDVYTRVDKFIIPSQAS